MVGWLPALAAGLLFRPLVSDCKPPCALPPLPRPPQRDYLFLKVELEGTSGEGSVQVIEKSNRYAQVAAAAACDAGRVCDRPCLQVKAFKPTAVRLFDPLAAALLGSSAPYAAPASDGEAEGEGEDRAERLHGALMGVYEYPDRRPGLYSYCKALEAVETGVLGGAFCLEGGGLSLRDSLACRPAAPRMSACTACGRLGALHMLPLTAPRLLVSLPKTIPPFKKQASTSSTTSWPPM